MAQATHPLWETAVERYDRIRNDRMRCGWSSSDASNYAVKENNRLMGNLRGACDWRNGKSY